MFISKALFTKNISSVLDIITMRLHVLKLLSKPTDTHPPVSMWFNYGILNDFLKEWTLRKAERKSGEITRDEYFKWKINWPYTCGDCGKLKPKKQWKLSKAELTKI